MYSTAISIPLSLSNSLNPLYSSRLILTHLSHLTLSYSHFYSFSHIIYYYISLYFITPLHSPTLLTFLVLPYPLYSPLSFSSSFLQYTLFKYYPPIYPCSLYLIYHSILYFLSILPLFLHPPYIYPHHFSSPFSPSFPFFTPANLSFFISVLSTSSILLTYLLPPSSLPWRDLWLHNLHNKRLSIRCENMTYCGYQWMPGHCLPVACLPCWSTHQIAPEPVAIIHPWWWWWTMTPLWGRAAPERFPSSLAKYPLDSQLVNSSGQ